MSGIRVLALGSGQDVGRSCVVVTLGGRNIMFDCGMHLGYRDHRRFPDFSLLSRSGNFTDLIDAVLITHFHLDHVGALPYFTEVCGYHGPIYMTYPTKAITPVMLDDFHKIMTERQGGEEVFTRQHIQDCMRRVIAVDLHQTVKIDADCQFRSYYAGHVLGAVMFHLEVGGQSVVYTGDYNMTPERHLGAAAIDRLRPDVLITESTYATTLRDSKRSRERDFLTAVHEAVLAGGKVLVPVFAVGRAQEMLILLDGFWERMNLQVPIYMSGGMASRANLFYRLMVGWSSPHMRAPEQRHSAFAFGRMQPWDRRLIATPGPCVLFATPGMLHGGVSLEVFKAWAGGELNLVILPGYQVAGTLGSKLMAGQTKGLQVDKNTKIDVNCKVRVLSFSAHADAKGILQLVQRVAPRHVVLVHGEPAKMEFLRQRIITSFGLPCDAPANATPLLISPDPRREGTAPASAAAAAAGPSDNRGMGSILEEVLVGVDPTLLERCWRDSELALHMARSQPVVLEEGEAPDEDPPLHVPRPVHSATVSGIIIERRFAVPSTPAVPPPAPCPPTAAGPPPLPPQHTLPSPSDVPPPRPPSGPPPATSTPAAEAVPPDDDPATLPPLTAEQALCQLDTRHGQRGGTGGGGGGGGGGGSGGGGGDGGGSSATTPPVAPPQLTLLSAHAASQALGLPTFSLTFSCDVPARLSSSSSAAAATSGAADTGASAGVLASGSGPSTSHALGAASGAPEPPPTKRARASAQSSTLGGADDPAAAAAAAGTGVDECSARAAAIVTEAAAALQALCGQREVVVRRGARHLAVRSFRAELVDCPATSSSAPSAEVGQEPPQTQEHFHCTWALEDDQLATECMAAMARLHMCHAAASSDDG